MEKSELERKLECAEFYVKSLEHKFPHPDRRMGNKRRVKMREIKFRGQRVDAKEWVYGYMLRTNKANPLPEETSWIFNESGKYKVIPETVGQFTGLLDKYGRKIFEGDLYTTFGGNVYEIRFVNGSFCGGVFDGDDSMFSPLGWESPDDDEDLYLDDELFKIMEVVGNIHDQKEDV